MNNAKNLFIMYVKITVIDAEIVARKAHFRELQFHNRLDGAEVSVFPEWPFQIPSRRGQPTGQEIFTAHTCSDSARMY